MNDNMTRKQRVADLDRRRARVVLRQLIAVATSNHVVVTPLVHKPDDEHVWYFGVATCGPSGFHLAQVVVGDERDETERGAVLLDLMQHQPALVVHDCDDELYAARLCEQLWPGERITRVRAAIEQERRREKH